MLKVRTNLQISPNRAQLPDFTFGVPYVVQLGVVNGKFPPYSWELTAGNLPPGVSLGSETGELAGVPGAAEETFDFSITVTDAQGNTGTMDYNEMVVGTLLIDQPVLPVADMGVEYNQQMTCTNAAPGPTIWTVSTGTLPPGLTMSASGLISGIPGDYGIWNFTIKVVDSAGNAGSRQYD